LDGITDAALSVRLGVWKIEQASPGTSGVGVRLVAVVASAACDPEKAEQELEPDIAASTAAQKLGERRRPGNALRIANEIEADLGGSAFEALTQRVRQAKGTLGRFLRRWNLRLGPQLASLRGGPGWH